MIKSIQNLITPAIIVYYKCAIDLICSTHHFPFDSRLQTHLRSVVAISLWGFSEPNNQTGIIADGL